MMQKRKQISQKKMSVIGRTVLLGALLSCTAGCHPSDGTTASPPPTPQAQAQNRANSVSAIQSNPNIPPEAKAHITAQIQGQAVPPTPGATHP